MNKIKALVIACLIYGSQSIDCMTSKKIQQAKPKTPPSAPKQSVAPQSTQPGLAKDLNSYSDIIRSADVFGHKYSGNELDDESWNEAIATWNAALKRIEKNGQTPATKQIIRNNDQLLKIIQDAHSKINTFQGDEIINKWKNDLDSIINLIFSGITATGDILTAGKLIQQAAKSAKAQIAQYRNQYWKVGELSRSRATASTTPPPPARTTQPKMVKQGKTKQTGKGMTVTSQ